MTVILAKMWRDIIGAAIAEVEIEIPSYNTTIGVKLKVSSNTQERHIPPCFLLDYSQKLRYRTRPAVYRHREDTEDAFSHHGISAAINKNDIIFSGKQTWRSLH